MNTIGVAGCGAMGLPMARALHRAGFDVYGHDIRPSSAFGDFAEHMIMDRRAFAARVDVVISVVRDLEQTHALLFGTDGVFYREPMPSTLVVSSTLSPRALPDLRARVPAAVRVVDAPMSGAPHAAESAQLSFMLGGDSAHLDELEPLFSAMGSRLFSLGAFGAGMTAKVLNNYVACASVVAVRRTFQRAAALGMDRQALRNVMDASSGATWFGQQFDAIQWSRQGYDPANTVGILEKDLTAALDAVVGCPRVAADDYDAALLDALRTLEPLGDGS